MGSIDGFEQINLYVRPQARRGLRYLAMRDSEAAYLIVNRLLEAHLEKELSATERTMLEGQDKAAPSSPVKPRVKRKRRPSRGPRNA